MRGGRRGASNTFPTIRNHGTDIGLNHEEAWRKYQGQNGGECQSTRDRRCQLRPPLGAGSSNGHGSVNQVDIDAKHHWHQTHDRRNGC
jgi:hypothetical protein